MFTSDTLASAASTSLFETTEPQLIADTMFRAPEFPATLPERDLRRGGVVNADIAKPESQAENAWPDPSPKKVAPENIRYYDLKRNWTKKIEPYLGDEQLNKILARDFNKFTMGRWGTKFGEDQLPHMCESAFSFFEQRGRFARYRWYTRHGACHWLVNFALRLAVLAVPNQAWRIITSDAHSTVWNGRDCLFDFNWFFMQIPAKQCFESAYGKELAPCVYLKVGYAIDNTVKSRPAPALSPPH